MQIRTVQLALAVFAGLLLTTVAVKSQMPNGIPAVGPVWEYATVQASSNPRMAEVCYAAPGGCRKAQEDIYSGGMPVAAAKLGEKGWELAAVSDHVLYFKRLKSVVHRND